ncbi:LysE family translocator [Sulfurospirillum barnesii]|uniref:Putative threonine efflux protein n=1 Tax=Sulfurospirillum barnesii (strain ATCC 700032 / DSM 10660 / SES-3) TaxID=760154 RepID=I3XZQ0_SULBS|nr:LysE family translocator [Sulfurospirillum barnesii]AFL69424.1 putative threonine efflux protein [Sulfurospirillum barnesii SES-3]
MPLELWTFLVAITLLSMTPGADTLIVIRNTLRGGAYDGLVSSLGICLGLFVHATLSAVGISAILLYSATAFMVLKTLGALYLIWLGFNALKSFWNAKNMRQKAVEKHPFSFWISLQEGFLSNVLNPKAVIFYMAFLPHFISHEHSALSQSLFLALLHFIIASLWQAMIVYTIVKANGFITKKSVRQSLDALSGSIMIALGIRLFLEER